MVAKLRTWGLVATLIAGAAYFALVVNGHYEIHRWLVWRYLGYWALSIAWALCCGAFGYAVLWKLRPRLRLDALDRLTLGFALGVFAFGLSIFLLGLVHALHLVTFFALPLAFAGFAVHALRRDWIPHRDCILGVLARPLRLGSLPLAALGCLGIALLYAQIITPDGFSFDVRWYHIPLAQRYALSGAISASPEGFWMAAYPQLSSYLYAWIFLGPFPILFDRLELCAHLEFVVFLLTLAQVPVVVRHLVPKARVAFTWVMPLAFPALYLYDSNLHAGADHIVALFALPVALTLWRAWRYFRIENVLLFSVFLSAAALTKYTALIMVVPAGLALFGRALWLTVRWKRRAWLGLVLVVVAPLVLTAPHWLKNWLWYGDPIYPILHSVLKVRPWSADAATQLAILETVARPGAVTMDGLLKALKSTIMFSFEANDWYELRRNVPLFGSLFTLTLPCLFFIRGARRIAWLYALSMAAVFVWFILSHYERFLQTILPWMAAATGACIVRIWQLGTLPRLALLPLVVFQVAWGSDAPFIRTHNLIGDSPLRRAALFIPSGFENTKNRLSPYEPLPTLGRSVPEDGVVLAHDVMMILGIDRNWVTDLHQSRISYGRLLTPAAIDKELKALGVTHLIWPNQAVGRDSLAGDLAFLNFAMNHTHHIKAHGNYMVAGMPKKTPQKLGGDRVAVYSCRGPYTKGWYRLSQLTLPIIKPGRAPKREATLGPIADASEKADYIVLDTACNSTKPAAGFMRAAARGSLELYIRDQHRFPQQAP